MRLRERDTLRMSAKDWTFRNLEANEKGLKPMPVEGAAQRAAVSGWWASLGTTAKVLVVGIPSILAVTGLSLGIAAAAGAFNGEEAATSEITLRLLTYSCAEAAETPSYSLMLGASGSSHSWKPAWEGTLYAKNTVNQESSSCVTEYAHYDGWPPVTSNSSIVPALPAGLTADAAAALDLSMVLDASTGYYHLALGGCILYYWQDNDADDWTKAIDGYWPVVKADGTGWASAGPQCS